MERVENSLSSLSPSVLESEGNCGGKRIRGSITLNARKAPGGRDEVLVSERRFTQTSSGNSGLVGFSLGWREAIRASVAAGPQTSMLPISKRKSSAIRDLYCFFMDSIVIHNCKNAEGWILIRILESTFISGSLESFKGEGLHQSNNTGAIGLVG